MNAIFVGGAGTGVGKTHVCELLLGAARARGRAVEAVKPVASGMADPADPDFAASDTARLLRALDRPASAEAIAACSPWRLRAPLSPDMAAEAEGLRIAFDDVLAWLRARPFRDLVIVEGVGGLMSPLCSDALNLDLAAALGAPVLLVGGSYLGAISHMLTALVALRSRGLSPACALVSESERPSIDLEATARTIRRFAEGVRVATLARGAPELPEAVARLVE